MDRKIMIIGNGEVPQEVADAIDAADMVIRFNGARNFGMAGHRTDVMAVCNTGRPAKAMLADCAWRNSPAVDISGAIWSVRDPAKFEAMKPDILVNFPELDDLFEDQTDNFAEFARSNGKDHVVLPALAHEAAVAALDPYDPGLYVTPSSGLVVMSHVLHDPAFAGDRIFVAGFSHTGWDGHPFAAERQVIDAHIEAGRLTRLGPSPLPVLSQGA
ncbi:Urease operon accessory protein [Agrobacterium vitis]|uniref:Urease operon accessory protein n=1 Tax=Agrobacterium vitis TaxID=373 RepID=UPI001574DDE5|nr:Urease operon accessory protein [Agrobacterium vitis]NSZ17600.1 Urease operon accessory protein [Agrobacterium vitis]QZO03291.1 Urease operon accessory protein [Agrobacterium vitis]UJL88411.1 Urease operon accessory protein [Agrobacterium vitis]